MFMPVIPGDYLECAMSQTIMTLGQLLQYKLHGFVQLDLFPEELEHEKQKQVTIDWYRMIQIEEDKLD
jgi:hypothetical protein